MSNLDQILQDYKQAILSSPSAFSPRNQAKQQVKGLMLELADELTDDMSGLGRDIINTDELKQRINEL